MYKLFLISKTVSKNIYKKFYIFAATFVCNVQFMDVNVEVKVLFRPGDDTQPTNCDETNLETSIM